MDGQQSRNYTFRVGNIQKSLATLVDLDYNIVQFPRYLLPQNVLPGSVIKMNLVHDQKQQKKRLIQVQKISNKVSNGLNSNKILNQQ